VGIASPTPTPTIKKIIEILQNRKTYRKSDQACTGSASAPQLLHDLSKAVIQTRVNTVSDIRKHMRPEVVGVAQRARGDQVDTRARPHVHVAPRAVAAILGPYAVRFKPAQGQAAALVETVAEWHDRYVGEG